MTALPLSRSPSDPEEEFERRVSGHERHFRELWSSSPAELRDERPRIGRRARRSNARHTRRLIDEVAARVERYPATAAARAAWRRELETRIRAFGEQRFDWPRGYRDLLVADEFWDSTVSFARAARDFAPSISAEDLFQALRNLWIINSVQMLLDLDVCCTPPAFAYSMLYPWTDNLLDSTELDPDVKRAFNRRLARRLAGVPVAPRDRHENEVHGLVERIEATFPRPAYPQVYASLRAIHRAQQDSLDQQASGLSSAGLLAVSVRKGGASLLPDGYLAAPDIDPSQERFLFGYGVFLQLLDDLQDVDEDLAAGHRTLFTLAARSGNLDAITARLRDFIDRCLADQAAFSGAAYRDRKDLIRRNCVALLVGAVAEQPRLYSRAFRRRIEAHWPLGLRALRRLRRYAEERFRRAGEVVCLQRGIASGPGATASLIELLCSESTASGIASEPGRESATASARESIRRS